MEIGFVRKHGQAMRRELASFRRDCNRVGFVRGFGMSLRGKLALFGRISSHLPRFVGDPTTLDGWLERE